MGYSVTEGPFRIENGKRILQCHSKGYLENGKPIFSPYGVPIVYAGKRTSLEDAFMSSRVFEVHGERFKARDWRHARQMMKAGCPQIGWDFGRGFVAMRLPVGPKDGFAAEEWGILFYIALWASFLETPEGQRRIEIARGFDGFEDPFAMNFPFGQEHVWDCAVKCGVETLNALADPVRDLMLAPAFP